MGGLLSSIDKKKDLEEYDSTPATDDQIQLILDEINQNKEILRVFKPKTRYHSKIIEEVNQEVINILKEMQLRGDGGESIGEYKCLPGWFLCEAKHRISDANKC